MALDSLDIYFNSSSIGYAYHLQKGDNISNLSVTYSDQDYYPNGVLTVYNLPNTQTIGDSILVKINGLQQFNGYVSRRQQHIDAGKKYVTYQLVGKTYDLWRYVIPDNITYENVTTCYIASSIVGKYCGTSNVITSDIDLNLGLEVTYELDLSSKIVGDALIELNNIDGYKFYIDNDSKLQYYEPKSEPYSFIIEESDIVEMSQIEDSDEDIINDVLVIGGSDYSSKTEVSTTHPNVIGIPGGDNLLAQRFKAENHTLSAIKLYLDRSLDPYQPGTLDFEIWENTSYDLFDDDFEDYSHLTTPSGIKIDTNNGGFLVLANNYQQSVGTRQNWGMEFSYDQTAVAFRPAQHCSPWRVRADIGSYGPGCQMKTHDYRFRIYATGSNGKPDDVTIATAYLYNQTECRYSDWAYFTTQPQLSSNKYYVISVDRTNGGKAIIDQGTASLATWIKDGGVWYEFSLLNPDDASIRFQARYYSSNGTISTNLYAEDCQYMKIDLGGVVSANSITISGSNNGGGDWAKLTDGAWHNFESESSDGCLIRYFMTASGWWTPKIDSASLSISDSTGTLNSDIFDDDFDNSTYFSSQSRSYINTKGWNYEFRNLDGYLHLSGSIGLTEGNKAWHYDICSKPTYWMCADSVEVTTDDVDEATWYNVGNMVIGSRDGDYAHFVGRWTGWITFTFDNPQFMCKRMKAKYNEGKGTEWQITGTCISGDNWGKGWVTTRKDNLPGWYEADPDWHTHVWDLGEDGYYYSGIKKVRFYLDCYNGTLATKHYISYFCFERIPFYKKGMIKTSTQSLGIDMHSMRFYPYNVTYPEHISYSGSLDSGSHWIKVYPEVENEFSESGKYPVLQYILSPSGTWGTAECYKSNLVPDTPRIGSVTMDTSAVIGGGIPKSGSKVEWSDDLSWNANSIPYPPNYSDWNAYTSPKLSSSSFAAGNYFWMIFNFPSSTTEYWKLRYDPNSTYSDGKIVRSWDNAGNWSSNKVGENIVESGNITFSLAWKEGKIRATASDEGSINKYGRHFKKIEDSLINTQQLAQDRADMIIENYAEPVKNGSIVIDGRENIDIEMVISSNLSNFGINELWEIVSYTQTIDNIGFTTTINYGKHPYDITRDIAKLKKEAGI